MHSTQCAPLQGVALMQQYQDFGPEQPPRLEQLNKVAASEWAHNPLTELESRHTETVINPPSWGSLCIHACSLEHRLHTMPSSQLDGGGIGFWGVEKDRLTGHAGGQALK